MSHSVHPGVFPDGDADTAEFWSGVARGELLVAHCQACGRDSFFPRVLCPHCHALGPTPRAASGRGVVYSYTVAHRAAPAFAEHTPFTVGLIDLAEGPRIMAEIVDEDGSLRIGDEVALRFRGSAGEPELFCFEPVNT